MRRKKKTIREKMFETYVLALLVVAIAFIVFYLTQTYQMMRSQITDSMSQLSANTAERIDDKFRQISALSERIVFSSDVRHLFFEELPQSGSAVETYRLANELSETLYGITGAKLEFYHMNLNDLLDAKQTKKNHPKKWMIGSIVIIFVLFLVLLIFLFTRQDGFEFKKLTASCDDFTLYGSIAYTESKSSIYISNISYCGEEDKQKYQELLCILYEEDGKSKTEISRYHYQESEPITIEKFASMIELHVDHYENTCNISEDDSLHLEIEATDLDGKITTYKIPLTLSDHCD